MQHDKQTSDIGLIIYLSISSVFLLYGVSTLKHYSVIHKRVPWRLKTATYYVCYISLSDVIYIQMLKSHYWAKIVALAPLKWAELVSDDDLMLYFYLQFPMKIYYKWP